MQHEENEIWIEKKIKLQLAGSIIYVTPYGDIDAEIAKKTETEHRKLVAKIKGTVGVIVDLNLAGKDAPEARKIWKDLNNEAGSYLALFGMHPVARVIASFYIGLTKNKRTSFFSTSEQALVWVKEMQKQAA